MGRPKSKDELKIIRIFNIYKKANLALRFRYYSPKIFDNEYKVSDNELIDTINFVQGLVQMLSPKSKLIIENDFINLDDSKWWYEYFSRPTYYRYKEIAISEFLHLISTPKSIKKLNVI